MYDFPSLRGNKIGPLWLRMLYTEAGMKHLRGLEKIPIPVDVHVFRATLTTVVIQGEYSGSAEKLYDMVREAWSKSTEQLFFNGRRIFAIDLDLPLWLLSKYGCMHRDVRTGFCIKLPKFAAKDFCVKGVIKIEKGRLNLAT